MTNIRLFPSLICLDAGNLLREVEAYNKAGFTTMHADIIDGHFSPSMPLGLETLRRVRQDSGTALDVHLMVEHNDYFLDEVLDIGAESVCFHIETIKHPQNWINRIKANGIKAGVALKPSTAVNSLECIMYDCDFVMLMLINPGYANSSSERQITYAGNKIQALKELIDTINPTCEIALDGRITPANIVDYAKSGAGIFVAGTSCFDPKLTLEKNMDNLKSILGDVL